MSASTATTTAPKINKKAAALAAAEAEIVLPNNTPLQTIKELDAEYGAPVASGYLRFTNQLRKDIKAKTGRNADMKELSDAWKELSKDEQGTYEAAAKKDIEELAAARDAIKQSSPELWADYQVYRKAKKALQKASKKGGSDASSFSTTAADVVKKESLETLAAKHARQYEAITNAALDAARDAFFAVYVKNVTQSVLSSADASSSVDDVQQSESLQDLTLKAWELTKKMVVLTPDTKAALIEAGKAASAPKQQQKTKKAKKNKAEDAAASAEIAV